MQTAEGRKQPLVLIVDDTALIRETGRDALEALGFEVIVAQDGREGLRAFRDEQPDVVLLDVRMPGMDGYQVCQEMRATPELGSTPVVMITASAEPDLIRRAFVAGATDFTPKPISWEILSSRIPYMLRTRDLVTDLARSEARLAKAQRVARLGNWELDLRTQVLSWSQELFRIYDIPAGERLDSVAALLAHVHPDDRSSVFHAYERAIDEGESLSVDHRVSLPDAELRFVHLQADAVHDETGRVIELVGTAQDITERKNAAEQIRFLAYHDGLTELGNRRLFTERLRHSLLQARRQQSLTAVVFLDLDHFKRINDTLGHAHGDSLLIEIARRLERCIRGGDFVSRAHDSDLSSTISRVGGDQFMISLCSISEPEEAGQVARRILQIVSEPCSLGGREIVVTASIGIAMSPGDGSDVEALIRSADAAAYAAKSQGRGGYCFYEREMNEIARRNLKLESDLRLALNRGELLVHYQPKMEIRSGRITGFEALARWEHPELGMVPPDVFIPVAERAGLVASVGEFVLRSACTQTKDWRLAGLPPVRMAVNLSAHQFRTTELVDVVSQILAETSVSPRSLDVEITESAMMQLEDLAVEVLQRLKGMGVTVSLDDFGTGYSSLSYLKQFPVDTVKIDRSFIRDLATNPDDAAITAAIISMGKALSLRVVAEGVETEEQLTFLSAHGCDEIQGYLFGRPMPAEEATRFFARVVDVLDQQDEDPPTTSTLPKLDRA